MRPDPTPRHRRRTCVCVPWRPALLAMVLLWIAGLPRAWDVDRAQQAAARLGPRAEHGLRALQTVLAAASAAEDTQRLDAVNQFFNRSVVFRDDTEVWRTADYWASPLETLQQGAGDCEDFAIAKYFALLATGMPASRLRLVYVRLHAGGAGGAGQPHMVLAYYAAPQSEPLILDNLVTEIRPASRRGDLTPVFSFNSEGLWQGDGAQSLGDPAARLSRWRDVLAKAKAEGFL